MAGQDDHDDQQPVLRISMWCPDCEGKGARWAPRAAVIGGAPPFAAQMQQCRTCDGRGRLEGFRPPM